MPKTRKNSRNASGSGSIRQRKDGKWEARYSNGTHPGTGKPVRHSIYGATQSEVRKELQKVLSAIDDGGFTKPDKMTLSQWLDIWLKEYTANLKENTAVSYETQVRQHIKPALGAVKLSGLTKHAVQSFYNDLQRGDKPLSAKIVKNIHGVFNRAMNQALELGYIRTNPCTNAKLPKVERHTIQPLSEDSTAAFLTAIKGQPLETLFRVVLFTGMRQSEVMGLTWNAIDFERGTILIDKQLIKEKKKDGVYKLASPKNNKSRLLSPAPSIMRMLKEQRLKQIEWKLKAGQAWCNDLNLVFVNELGQHFAHNTLSRSFKRIAKKIDLPDNCFHDLRHTYAVNSLQNGDDPKTLQENLGHHAAAFTLDVYGHVSERMKKDSASRMDAFIQRVDRSG